MLSLFNEQKTLAKANVWLGKRSQINIVAQKSLKKIVSPLQLNKTKIRLEWMDPLSAPILKGDVVGKIYINIPGNDIIHENLISAQDVDKMSSFMRLKTILKFLLYGDIIAE